MSTWQQFNWKLSQYVMWLANRSKHVSEGLFSFLHILFQIWEKSNISFILCKIVLTLLLNLLVIQTGPVCTDKVPCQGLTDTVTSNRGNNRGGVHPTDLLSVQTISQVPETHNIKVSWSGGKKRIPTCKICQKSPKQNWNHKCVICYLLSSHGFLVQARAFMSFSASEATVAFLYKDQAKSHSASPPSRIALQYTTDFRLGLILDEGVTKEKGLFTPTEYKEEIWRRTEECWARDRGGSKTFGLGLNVAFWTHLLSLEFSINSLNQPVVSCKHSSNPLLQATEMAVTWLYLHRDTTAA